MAYHYTTIEIADQIVMSGAILPATAGVPEGERPVVWFSRAKTWEPTANKGRVNPLTGLVRTLTFPEMVKAGIARFRVSPSILVPWTEIPGLGADFADALVRTARKQGSNPRDWLVSLDAVPMDAVESIDFYQGNRWLSIEEIARAEEAAEVAA